jgi:hypothetical protein
MGLSTIIAIGTLLVLVVGAIGLLLTKKSDSDGPASAPVPTTSPQPPPTELRASIRQQELAEDAQALAAEFQRAKQQQYLDGLRREAAEFFATRENTAPATDDEYEWEYVYEDA